MKKKLNVFYWKLQQGYGNFGDELNNYLISKLSGSKVDRVIIPLSGFNYLSTAIRYVIYNQISYRKIPILIKQFFIDDFILGIGSVLSRNGSRYCKVWGAGIMSKDDDIKEAVFCAVRGKYSQKRLKELNLSIPSTIGDPAILLPMVYSSNSIKKFKLGVIPHYIHYRSVKEQIKDESTIVICLTDPIETIIDQINSCDYTISTSLHGIIVAQAYNIPSLWFTYGEKLLPGDNIKFYDYFSSIGIDEYLPFTLKPEEFNISNIIELFSEFRSISFMKSDLNEMQRKLLEVAPFQVLKEYKLL